MALIELPGEKLLIRMWDTITAKGIGALLKPWQMRREGTAQLEVRRQEMLALAQVERDVDDIRAGKKRLDQVRGLVALPPPIPRIPLSVATESVEGQPPDFPAIAQVATNNFVADAIRKEVNIAKALLAAEADLQDSTQQPPDRRIDDDWLYRWRDSASEVSTEELQGLWGRLLAGEMKSPGTFSLRTLEFLRNVSHFEAEAIASLSRFVIADLVYRGDQELLDAEGINFGFLLSMQQLGILSGVEAISLSITWRSSQQTDRFVRPLVSHGKALIVSHDDPNKELTLSPVCRLTSIGAQIQRLGKFEAQDRYIRAVGKRIRDQGFKVSLARWEEVTATEGRYTDAEVL
jgi:hypothetical protein